MEAVARCRLQGLAVQLDDVDQTVNAHGFAEVSCNTLQWFVRYCISGNDDNWNVSQNRVSSSSLELAAAHNRHG